jgi:hypothetical protein
MISNAVGFGSLPLAERVLNAEIDDHLDGEAACAGYSGRKSVSNDGILFISENGSEYDPLSHFSDEQSCEDTLSNLAVLYEGRFDFAVMDGNHEAEYLRCASKNRHL